MIRFFCPTHIIDSKSFAFTWSSIHDSLVFHSYRVTLLSSPFHIDPLVDLGIETPVKSKIKTWHSVVRQRCYLLRNIKLPNHINQLNLFPITDINYKQCGNSNKPTKYSAERRKKKLIKRMLLLLILLSAGPHLISTRNETCRAWTLKIIKWSCMICPI